MRALSPLLPAALAVAALFVAPPARAQLLNQLQSAAPSVSVPSVSAPSAGGVLGALGGGGVPSVGSASPGNLAGVLHYCIQNNDVSSGAARSVQSQLMSKLGGQASSDPGYGAGQGGTLETGPGGGYSLGGTGIKQEVTRKVCNMVLQRAQSML
jgi:hypothetical protein